MILWPPYEIVSWMTQWPETSTRRSTFISSPFARSLGWLTIFGEFEAVIGYRVSDPARPRSALGARLKGGTRPQPISRPAGGGMADSRAVGVEAKKPSCSCVRWTGSLASAGTPARQRRFSIREILPPHDPGPWPEGFTVSREHIYDNMGRLTGRIGEQHPTATADQHVRRHQRSRRGSFRDRALAHLSHACRSASTAPATVRSLFTSAAKIVREYLVVVTRPQIWSEPLATEDALEDAMRLVSSFTVLEDGPNVMADADRALCREVPAAGKQIHDANIAATMLAHGERRLLTLNAKDFRRYGKRIELVDLEPAA